MEINLALIEETDNPCQSITEELMKISDTYNIDFDELLDILFERLISR